MEERKVLFVGVGSIARRHIKNITEVLKERGVNCHIDVFRSSNWRPLDSAISAYVSEVYYELEKVPNNYDIIFITNPTEYHLQTLKDFHNKGQHFLWKSQFVAVSN